MLDPVLKRTDFAEKIAGARRKVPRGLRGFGIKGLEFVFAQSSVYWRTEGYPRLKRLSEPKFVDSDFLDNFAEIGCKY